MIQSAAADAALSARHDQDESRWKRPPARQAPLSPAGARAIPVPPRPSTGIRFTSDDLDEVRAEARQHTVAPGRAVFLAPGMEFTRRSEPGSVFAIAVDATALDLELQSRRPVRRHLRDASARQKTFCSMESSP